MAKDPEQSNLSSHPTAGEGAEFVRGSRVDHPSCRLARADAGGKSIGPNIVLRFEQAPTPQITPDLCFRLHCFIIRKMNLPKPAKGLAAFPRGFDTLDELFVILTPIQTQQVRPPPLVLVGTAYRDRLIDFDFTGELGAIAPRDHALFRKVENTDEAFDYLSRQ